MTGRRSFLRGASVVLGHASLGNVLTAFAASTRQATFLSEAELQTVRTLVDLILPATDSPSASAAGTHYFLDLALPACASPTARPIMPWSNSGATSSEVYFDASSATALAASRNAPTP
jgi:hypothetical protein